MAERIQKHTHKNRVIAHSMNWDAALLSCETCFHTTAIHPDSKELRQQVKPRIYRPMTIIEFAQFIHSMKHLCCG